MERLALLDDVEEDIGIQEDTHRWLDAVFLSIMRHAGVVGGFAGNQPGDTSEALCPSSGASAFAGRSRGKCGFPSRRLYLEALGRLQKKLEAIGEQILEALSLKSRASLGFAEKVVWKFDGGSHKSIFAYYCHLSHCRAVSSVDGCGSEELAGRFQPVGRALHQAHLLRL